MRESGRMLALVLQKLVSSARAGMTTKDLAVIAGNELKSLGGKPSFLNYQGFPDVLCVSVNDEVVHGIPGDRLLLAGDIVSVDFGVTYRGMITDAARSIVLGGSTSNPADQKLVAVTLEALDAGIFMARPQCRVGDISSAIQAVLDRGGYGIIRDLVGHGVGHELHEEPNIPNYGSAGKGPVLEAGMTLALEPMSTRGGHRVRLNADGWTVHTADGTRSAHFEDTILLTDRGAEILTRL